MSNFGSIRKQRKCALFPGELQFSDWQIFTKIAMGWVKRKIQHHEKWNVELLF